MRMMAGSDGAIGLRLAGSPTVDNDHSRTPVLSFAALASNPVMNGSTIVSQASDPATFLSNPYREYAEAGWAGMGDWLGYARKH